MGYSIERNYLMLKVIVQFINKLDLLLMLGFMKTSVLKDYVMEINTVTIAFWEEELNARNTEFRNY